MDVFHESRFFRQYQAFANVLTLPLGKPSKLLPQEVVMIIRHGRAVSQGKQGLFWGGAAGGLPSPPPAGALSPAGSGDAAQWAAPITDRRGSGDQALNGAHWAPAPPKRGGETWSSASLWWAALSVLANASPPPPKGEARLGLLQASGGLPSPSSLTRVHLPQRGRQDLAFCKPLVGCPLRPR